MTTFDYAALGIVGLSILLSVMRGLTQEILALCAWVLAFWCAMHYSAQVSLWMPESIPTESLRYLGAFATLFFIVWLLSAIFRITLNQFIKATGFKPIDRVLGAGFGVARGYLLVLTLVLLAGFTSLPKEPEWRNAMFSPLFEQSAFLAKSWLPEAFASRIHYD
ncbi:MULTISPECIES: CvpA family protein [Deefgea]|uniref:CvpA family protein n=1 Tax=Deefgea chitinilytica TaxID=570276 RepID=A0ABS2C8K2_9NEIS|nr:MULTISPECIES: CvpA family protein [Deefgea]MBM5570387.1 CvpA family protein [Deefgea chitinilytica]MBM9887616.1 CvpA family protein [Deefgea sp. CFH1-16]